MNSVRKKNVILKAILNFISEKEEILTDLVGVGLRLKKKRRESLLEGFFFEYVSLFCNVSGFLHSTVKNYYL